MGFAGVDYLPHVQEYAQVTLAHDLTFQEWQHFIRRVSFLPMIQITVVSAWLSQTVPAWQQIVGNLDGTQTEKDSR